MADPRIVKFRGTYEPFSMFYDAPFEMYGITFPTGEHALHWHKTTNNLEKLEVLNSATPQAAKRIGRRVTLVSNWDSIREEIAYKINMAKFSQNPDLKRLLLSTGDTELIEGNTWHDNIWGSCSCGQRSTCGNGRNMLGKILMRVRHDLRTGVKAA